MNKILDELSQNVIDTQKMPFVMAYKSFLLNEEYTVNQKMLILVLKSYAGNKVDCYPSKSLLARQLKVTTKTIETVLKQLQNLGALLIINRITETNRKTSNLYIIADIDIISGNFIPDSLDMYRSLTASPIRIKGK